MFQVGPATAGHEPPRDQGTITASAGVMTMTTRTRICASILSTAIGALLLTTQAFALTYTGVWLTDAFRYSLVRDGDTPSPVTDPDQWLYFDAGQPFTFDVTGTTLTAGGPQVYSLSSTSGATATFTLLSLVLDLSGPNGLAGGSMDYQLDGVAGTFTFLEQIYADSVFNTSSFDGAALSVFIWGGDPTNVLSIDGGFTGSPVPLPGALILFASALGCLGFGRRHK